jgi:hypothetical protein
MFNESNVLDDIGMYKQADDLDKIIIIAYNNFNLTKKKKNPLFNINMQLLMMKNKLKNIEGQFSESMSNLGTDKSNKITPQSNQHTNINYLSNAPMDIDNTGNNNDTTIKVE